ncbi:MAG: methyltransferase domain-containing protein, partial [Deltaproteobacteria bacterium]|nr:methyltransferase domain-containing protein [Deltaproteobacteria bacterium]
MTSSQAAVSAHSHGPHCPDAYGPVPKVTWERLFDRAPLAENDRRRRVLDLGCGDGEFLVESARARPDCDHLGIDLLAPVIDRARAKSEGLGNVAFVVGDAVEWIERLERLEEVHVYHPLPYFHPEIAQLGLLTPRFFQVVWDRMTEPGTLSMQTDHKAYGRYMILAAQRCFETTVVDTWPDLPFRRTRWEKISNRRKRTVLRIVGRRRSSVLEGDDPASYFEQQRKRVRGA